MIGSQQVVVYAEDDGGVGTLGGGGDDHLFGTSVDMYLGFVPAGQLAGAFVHHIDIKLPPGEFVNFWTEASLFSSAGLPALVLGPGNIAQAHAVDEWVELEQLETACQLYGQVVNNDG